MLDLRAAPVQCGPKAKGTGPSGVMAAGLVPNLRIAGDVKENGGVKGWVGESWGCK